MSVVAPQADSKNHKENKWDNQQEEEEIAYWKTEKSQESEMCIITKTIH